MQELCRRKKKCQMYTQRPALPSEHVGTTALRCFSSSLGWTVERNPQDDIEQLLDARMNALRQIGAYRLWKRSHNIEPRGLSQFKNCYFSPIQCVLMERRRR
ncbi:hypothetical protein Y032_0350g3227 [Ancylostoma ceylanicum]|uniref:Uncharacterized protein n=1 Tax=Ancylostoma ceylanicum TaxID=53326 RepID=A0A016RWY0_9BILA|nr:hypothetical protein Y032_0350g3227 [Ancylostoma ceylanicum]